MGAGFLVAQPGHHVLSVDHIRMLQITRTAARLLILRDKPDADAALAWEICRSLAASIST
jgi:hypothetical protein